MVANGVRGVRAKAPRVELKHYQNTPRIDKGAAAVTLRRLTHEQNSPGIDR